MRISRILAPVGALVGLGLVCGAAFAAEELQQVQVEATRMVNTKIVGRSASGVPISEISVTYRVDLSDLDLATYSGATDAEQRVKTAAAAACRQIARLYPRATPSDKECARQASDNAMARVHELVADRAQHRQ